MQNRNTVRWTLLITANVTLACMLGFHQSGSAAQKGAEPFANAVQQRAEMIEQLKEVGALLKEQNALLRDGKLQVIVTSEKK